MPHGGTGVEMRARRSTAPSSGDSVLRIPEYGWDDVAQLLDRDGPFLASAVYAHLMQDLGEPDPITGKLMTERWANLIHIGARRSPYRGGFAWL